MNYKFKPEHLPLIQIKVRLIFIYKTKLFSFQNYMVFYTTNNYQLTQSSSSIIIGGIIVPSAILGAILGGLVVQKLDLDIEGCTNLIMLNSAIAVACLLVILLVPCEGRVTSGIDLFAKTFNSSYVCETACNCTQEYSPVCGIDAISYVSPCYAGCKVGIYFFEAYNAFYRRRKKMSKYTTGCKKIKFFILSFL